LSGCVGFGDKTAQVELNQGLVRNARPCATAEGLPLVGVGCKIIHGMYRAAKSAKKNRESCVQFGETLRGLEVILIKAARLKETAAAVKGLEAALWTASVFLKGRAWQMSPATSSNAF